jgi:hypothetical protein
VLRVPGFWIDGFEWRAVRTKQNTLAQLDALLHQKMDDIQDEFRPVSWYWGNWFEDRVVLRAARGDFALPPKVEVTPTVE